MADFIYRGFSFPFRAEGGQFPAASQDADLIRESVVLLLSTPKRSRLMRPEIGVDALKVLFEPNSDLIINDMRAEVLDTLSRFEPRIIPTNVRVLREDNQIIVIVDYIIRATQQTDQAGVSARDPYA